MKSKITIVSGIQITDNPRVFKEACELVRQGYRVEVLLTILDPTTKPTVEALAQRYGWTYTAVIDRSQRGLKSRLHWLYLRMRKRVAGLLLQRLGREHPYQLGYCVPELLKAALRSKADLYSIHLYQGLWVGARLLERKKTVYADFEDWYSEDFLPADRVHLPLNLVRALEKKLLAHSRFTLTTSQVLAEALAKQYDVPQPRVLYNVFSLQDREARDGQFKDRNATDRISVFWFSQSIGPGRGLERLAEAAHQLTDLPLAFHFRGAPSPHSMDFVHTLKQQFPPVFADHVHVHPRVPMDELLSRISEHDIGYACELDYCLSRELTITNKILQYLLAGIAVVASDTHGQREVAGVAPKAVSLFDAASPESLASAIRQWAQDREALREAKQAADTIAVARLNWEKNADVLVSAVKAVTAR